MIKAAFFDMDGTLYSHKSRSVPDSTLQALKQLQDSGIKVFIATGRHFEEIDQFPVGKIPFDGYIMLTGQLCTDANRKVLYGCPIEGADKDYLCEAFAGKAFPMLFVEKNRFYLNFVNEMVIAGQADVSSPVPEVGQYSGGPLYQIDCYGGKELEALVSARLADCKITRWSPSAFNIVTKAGGKVNGIKRMLELNNISREETIAFGDGENDLEMLEFVKIGVAMGNAEEQVKAVADYVTTDVDEDGIYSALKHYGLI